MINFIIPAAGRISYKWSATCSILTCDSLVAGTTSFCLQTWRNDAAPYSNFLQIPTSATQIRKHYYKLTIVKTYHSPHFCEDFTELYNKVNSSLSVESSLADLDAEHHFNSLNTVWTDILNSIALFKCFKLKPKSEPWTDNNIRSLRQSCREAERKWKKDKLQISFGILKNCLSLYQRAVKKAKTSYFSNLMKSITVLLKYFSLLLTLL